MSSIKVSPKHGLNPSVVLCPICGKDTSVALFGRLKGDAEAPRQVVGNEPCNECKEKMETFVFIMEVKSIDNQDRTGRGVWIPKGALNVECPNGIALMAAEDFTKTFETNYAEEN